MPDLEEPRPPLTGDPIVSVLWIASALLHGEPCVVGCFVVEGCPQMHMPLTAQEARELAGALMQAADSAERVAREKAAEPKSVDDELAEALARTYPAPPQGSGQAN